MNSSDIKDICLNGSKDYYNFLANKPNGGVEEINIKSIEKIDEKIFNLKIDKKLFDPDSTCYQYNGKFKKTFTGDQISIKLYDNDQRVLIIRVNEEILPLIDNKNHLEWKIIIDLKFLVQRVIDWYELNGTNLQFHPIKSKSENFNIKVIPKNGDPPSNEQLDAISIIFSKNFSYVWGAPGTGKTKSVLSNALLHYVEKKQRTLILAPTNVALEQIFEGVLSITDKVGISKNKLLRLGYPSKEFADKFGEVCEIQGIEKELKRINEQILIISAILGIENENEIKINRKLNALRELQNLSLQILKLNEQNVKNNYDLSEQKKVIQLHSSKIIQIEKEIKLYEQKQKSFISQLINILSKNIDYTEVLVELNRNKDTFHKIKGESEEKLNQIIEKCTSVDKEIKIIQTKYKALIDDYKNVIDDSIKDNVNYENEITETLLKLNKEKEQAAVYKSLAKEYENHSQSELTKLFDGFIKDKVKLESYSIEARIENTLIMGATLDTYLHRFKEKKVDLAHIFLDEAGYASVVKALTLFTNDIPITFLGDHKQLPPVCEISKSDIKKDEKLQKIFVWDQSAIFIGDLLKAENLKESLENYFALKEPSKENLPTAFLTISHRFGTNLASTLEKYVYKGGFKSSKQSDTEIIICNAVNPIEARTKGRLNEAEAICIKDFIENNFISTDSVAILSPYRDQVKRLEHLLPEFHKENKILTVHKSQGREWETVIFSVCDIGNGRIPWFTDSINNESNGLNNINTAVSRAKSRLVIFCSKEEWLNNSDQLISGIIKAGTKVIEFDTSKITVDLPKETKFQYSNFDSKKDFKNSSSKEEKIKGKDYVPSELEEEWESQLLFWSKKKKEGYIYSGKKNAWFKKK